MNAFMYRIVPFLIAMVVGEFIYYKLDQSYQLTEKMYQKLHIRRENLGRSVFVFRFLLFCFSAFWEFMCRYFRPLFIWF